MNDYAYSREKSAPAGSNLYYSSLFYNDNKKEQLFGFFAFAATLSEIIDQCSDPGVARIKLQWWHEEVERIFDQEDKTLLHRLIAFEEQKLHGFNVRTPDELLEHLLHGPGLLWYICVKCFGHIHPVTPESARETGSLLAFFNILQNSRRDISYGRLYLPQDELESAGISQRHLLDKDSDNTREFFYKQILFLIDQLNKNFRKFPAEDRPGHSHVRIMNRLQHGLCKAVISDDCNLLTRKISLTPLHKLWIAWRTNIKN